MLKFIYIVLFLCITSLQAISVDNNTHLNEILSQSKIYIDNTRSLSLKNIIEKEEDFKDNNESLLAYGYAPKFDVWVQFTLKNTTDKPIKKILEYDNPLTTHIEFYNPSDHQMIREGLYQVSQDRKTVNPVFTITLQPNESKMFYMKVSSHITTLIIKLKLWTNDTFFQKEIRHQFILALFFGAMFILCIYNLFIYFFTKDISYFYYVVYILGIILHQTIYTGLSNIYLFEYSTRILLIEYASIVVAFPIFFLAFFTKSFLRLEQYPLNNRLLNIYLILFPCLVIIFQPLPQYRHIFTLLLHTYLVIITIYAALKNNSQAYYILFGWFGVLFSVILMYVSSIGLFNIHKYQLYIVEIVFILEAVIFSIALANRIKQLQKEKDNANAQLIYQQENEKKLLTIKVSEKTNDLKSALDEKEMLLKELNHRVKNNMQTIVSLIRLQLDDIDDIYVKNILSTTYNRITAMSHLHELLYYQTDISNIDAEEYFVLLTDEIRESYSQNINIHLNISAELQIEQAIYCGLILNELATNALKHAFKENKGNLYINLTKDSTHYHLSVLDDGDGYTKKASSSSLGLILVNSLVKSKLHGIITTQTNNGVQVNITWEIHNG